MAFAVANGYYINERGDTEVLHLQEEWDGKHRAMTIRSKDGEPQTLDATVYHSKRNAKTMENEGVTVQIDNSLCCYTKTMQNAPTNETVRRRLFRWFVEHLNTNFDDEIKKMSAVGDSPRTFATCPKHFQARLVFFQSLIKKLLFFSVIRQKLDDYCFQNIVYIFFKREGDVYHFLCHETNDDVFLCTYEKSRRQWTITQMGQNVQIHKK